MGVMESMRSGSDSTFMQVVMALVVVSFIGWYAVPQGDKANVVAEVNGVRIMTTEYSRAYRNTLRAREVQLGRTLADEEQRALGEQVEQELIEQEVILQEARGLGMEVSDREVAATLLDLPQFQNRDGEYDPELYNRWLKRYQYTPDAFQEMVREDLLRRKLRMLVLMGATVSDPDVERSYIEANTKMDLTTVRIRPSNFFEDVALDDESRDAWLAENEQLAREAYERDFERLYNHPERVRLRMIRLDAGEDGADVADVLPRLNQIRESIEAGEPFETMAAEWSEDPSAAEGGDLGMRAVPQLGIDVIDAIEGLEPGHLSRVLTTEADVRLFKVEEREAAYSETYEDVRDEIADRLIREERAPALAAAFAEEELLPRWTEEGSPPQELLDAHGLVATSTGLVAGRPLGGPPDALIADAREARPGSVLAEVYEENAVYFVGQLTERQEPDMAAFEEQRQAFREQILLQKRVEFYQSWVMAAKARAAIRS